MKIMSTQNGMKPQSLVASIIMRSLTKFGKQKFEEEQTLQCFLVIIYFSWIQKYWKWYQDFKIEKLHYHITFEQGEQMLIQTIFTNLLGDFFEVITLTTLTTARVVAASCHCHFGGVSTSFINHGTKLFSLTLTATISISCLEEICKFEPKPTF